MELQDWVGSLHDNMMKVMDVAEAKEGRLMELDIRMQECLRQVLKYDLVTHFHDESIEHSFQAPPASYQTRILPSICISMNFRTIVTTYSEVASSCKEMDLTHHVSASTATKCAGILWSVGRSHVQL